MLKYLKIVLSVFLMLLVISCTSTTKEQVTAEDYKNATKHLSSNLNQFVYNTVSIKNWENEDFLNYNLKTKEGNKTYQFNFKTGETSLLENDDFNSQPSARNRNEFVSPDGKKAVFIEDYNLWVKDLETKQKTQLTFDGYKDYGYATNNAGWTKGDNPVLKWSPDSKKIATFRQDARGVGEMYLTSTNVGHPRLEAWKYALPGDSTIFQIERMIIDISNANIVRFNMENDFQRSTTTDHIAGRGGELLDTQWNKDASKLAFISSSRDHKIAHLQIADAKTGNVTSIFKEETETYYESGVNSENWSVLFDSNEFIWYSEKDNWGHLYLYDLTTKELKNRITKGEWLVRQLLHIDEENRQLYFTAGGKEEGNPYHVYLYKVNFDGSNLVCLTPEKGTHNINPKPNWNYFIDTYSTTSNPPITVVRDNNGNIISELAKADISELKANNWQQPIEFSVKARDDKTDLYGIMYLPSHYDESKKYPVLNYIYPGPQSGSVGSYPFRTTSRDNQAMAELGFVVVAVDAQGTPGRSKSFHDFYYGNMGDNGIPDNIAAIKQLAQQYKGMDIERVGIWGHSGGGFASTGALLRYPEFYDVAVSGAGNHDNRNYEADWGEKWQGLLESGKLETENDGTTNYDNQANQLQVDNLKGKLLITHGSMDNNVPPSNTMLMVEALIKANKDFDFILFPNKRHGYGDMTNYMTRRKWDYFVKHLKGVEPPKEFNLSEF
jgi:dipeptidyl aminopeptidase/acylaminoacyl peptidase